MIINVTDWEKEEYGVGTRKKYLYIEPLTMRKAFFKYPGEDRITGKKIMGEVWSEEIAVDIGKVIGVPTPDVFIAENEDGYGSLSFNFLKMVSSFFMGLVFGGYI